MKENLISIKKEISWSCRKLDQFHYTIRAECRRFCCIYDYSIRVEDIPNLPAIFTMMENEILVMLRSIVWSLLMSGIGVEEAVTFCSHAVLHGNKCADRLVDAVQTSTIMRSYP